MFRTFFENVRVKIACKDPTNIPFERLIGMKKKLFLLGFTVEGFEQVGGIDFVVDEEDIDEDDLGEDQDKLQETNLDDIQTENMSDGNHAIDELDKANLDIYEKSGGNSRKVIDSAINHVVKISDLDHENFIQECMVANPCLSATKIDYDEQQVVLATETSRASASTNSPPTVASF